MRHINDLQHNFALAIEYETRSLYLNVSLFHVLDLENMFLNFFIFEQNQLLDTVPNLLFYLAVHLCFLFDCFLVLETGGYLEEFQV